MSNLTKYEILKHRHLALLKKLDDMGVSATFSQLQGEWVVNTDSDKLDKCKARFDTGKNFGGRSEALKTDPQCAVCMGKGRIRGPYLRSKPCPAIGCPFREWSCTWDGKVYNADHTTRAYLVSNNVTNAFSPDLSVGFYDQVYAREWYTKKPNGEVTKHRDIEASVPQWVRDFQKKYETARNPWSLRVIVDAGKVHATIAGEKFDGLEYSGLLHDLINALRHAILAASPAKVD